MLVRSVIAQHIAVRRALEGLEAGLALDSEGGGVLFEHVSQSHCSL